MEKLYDVDKIRGVCYNPNFNKEWKQIEYELQCAKRLNLNSIRFWLNESEWEEQGKEYIRKIVKFVELCKQYEISLMPILWNGNYITQFNELSSKTWEKKELYAQAVIGELQKFEEVIIWDIINEPLWNDYLRKANANEYAVRYKELEKYTRNLCTLVKYNFPDILITVGHERPQHCETTIDIVDIISFHDYSSTRTEIQNVYEKMLKLSDENMKKPILNSETGCIGRANPYEIELEMCQKYHFGWYLFNLVIEGEWGDIHGLIYPDGSIRDPAVIAALYGFFRNKTSKRILPNPNKEGHVYRALENLKLLLAEEEESLFVNKKKDRKKILEAIEYCVNILEICEMVPMDNPLSVTIQEWRNIPESELDMWKMKKFAYQVAKTLKDKCFFL